jgi:branched-chain amino acid transport system permease protein
VLGVVFVLLVWFLRGGIVGALADLWRHATGRDKHHEAAESDPTVVAADAIAKAVVPVVEFNPSPRNPTPSSNGTILQAEGLTKRYGGLIANDNIDFTVKRGQLRGIIGPNGAGKTTFFKMLTREIPPTSGVIRFDDRDITGLSITQVCQLGLTKSYQVNQLFSRLTVRDNITVAALSQRGQFRLDFLRSIRSVRGLTERVEETLELMQLTGRADVPVSDLAYGEKRRLEIGLALATTPKLLLLDEPLAGLSPRERVETVKLMKSLNVGRTMVVIDHDMDAIFELAETITVLVQGRILVEGTPEEIRRNEMVQEAYLGAPA